MGQDRLTGLALMHIHYTTQIDLDDVINIFARQHPRHATSHVWQFIMNFSLKIHQNQSAGI